MIKFNILKKGVVDRIGLPYSPQVNDLRWRTTHSRVTQSCGVPQSLANLKSPQQCFNTVRATTTELEVR